jgi:hypothetical protein
MSSRPLRIGLACASASLLWMGGSPLSPAPLQAAALPQQASRVRLLVPLETGHELELLLPLVPAAQLLQIQRREYVVLGSFADARVAYRLGRTIQRRTRLPFELAYDADHPQSDGRWLALERGTDPLPRSTARALPSPPDSRQPGRAVKPPQGPASETGELPGYRAARLALALQVPPAEAARDSRAVPPPALVASAVGQRPEPPVMARTPPAATLAAAPPEKRIVVSLRRSRWLALNSSLNYLFVRLNAKNEAADLQRIVAVADLIEANGVLLAQVGVFTDSAIGRRLLHQRLQLLSAQGFRMRLKLPGAQDILLQDLGDQV